jgi:hypothetical protein
LRSDHLEAGVPEILRRMQPGAGSLGLHAKAEAIGQAAAVALAVAVAERAR